MIGYYVHHRGSGHLHRAGAVARALDVEVTGLSSLPRPADWAGPWVDLAADDTGPAAYDATARGHLHWVPQHDEGLRARTAQLSAWIEAERPALLVSDVSVEVTLLARLHGVPVVSVVLPGRRDDPAHALGLGVSAALVAVWPPAAAGMVGGLRAAEQERLRCVGALSRFDVRPPGVRRPGPPRVTVLLGDGGDQAGRVALDEAAAQTPGWDWTVLGRGAGTWTPDPFATLCDADVVVTHAGQNALAEVAAARRPAIVVPADRPHDEQRTTAAVLRADRWPVLVEDDFPATGWPARLAEAAAYDGSRWSSWVDGRAAERFAGVLRSVLMSPREQEQAS